MKKIYILSGDETLIKASYNTFGLIGNTQFKSYDRFVNDSLNKIEIPISINNKSKILNNIKEILEKNKVFYINFNKFLDETDTPNGLIFIFTNNTYVINKLKVKYKRPNYVTLLLKYSFNKVNIDYPNIKYDHIITYVNDKQFVDHLKRFSLQVPNYNRVRTK